MKLDGVEYGNVFCAPGARGFFGEGYPWHRYWKRLGLNWDGTTFAAKTTTLDPRAGNMPLRADGLTPREFSPRCIVVKPLSGHVLNAVGLSGPGAWDLVKMGFWQQMPSPFMISFMSVGQTRDYRLRELVGFVTLLNMHLSEFRAPFALQLNFACPNTGHGLQALYPEIGESLQIAARLRVPLILNMSPITPSHLLLEVAKEKNCAGIWLANTIPWGSEGVNWMRLFRSKTSPLEKLGLPAGGLSGPACLPIVLERIAELREAGLNKPVVGGNGIQSPKAAIKVRSAGASAVALGVIGLVRPWRMRSTISAGVAYDE